ncbi:type II secretion system F family protein [Tessaracoccus sp. MC1756]|uniref:type II secretion system F family protein n=1 Tax=Tessaracoccus sp. MC1756 TaxID=2760311 RepID=UPI0016017D0F|nr:type II secretion system F family protein [Tessaracoccus sp. MC1756]MBB1509467.1 type II secretion system F family protein [Tessaracoccus sp. MC1756]
MSGDTLAYIGGGLVSTAVLTWLVLYFTAGRTVPMSRRRPPDAAPAGLVPQAAKAASSAAGYALGGRARAVEESLAAAGIRMRPQDFMVLVASGAVAGFALGLLLGGPVLPLLALILVPLAAVLSVRFKAAKRRQLFGDQLEETLSTLSGSLRAGFSLPQACATVATELDEPTSSEFSRVVNETRLGRPFVEALADVARRNENEDFDWVVQAIAINREVGGNLADVLAGVGATIRERVQLKRQVGALAAEGKLSGVILGALPPGMFLVLWAANPTYIGRFGESIIGIGALIIAGIMMAVGMFWLSRVIKIRF